MIRRKVAVVQTLFIPGGGTEAVTAWALEALKREYQVTLFTFNLVDAQTLNRYYGTRLGEDEVTFIQPSLPPLLARTRRFSLLKDHLMMRYCKSVRHRFDLFFSMGAGMDFGGPGMQYIAYAPASNFVKVLSRDPEMPGWYYLLKMTFMRLCERISGFSVENLKGNVTLVTSAWTGKIVEEIYSLHDYEVVYPPVDAPTSTSPWEMRRDGFLCVARIVPEKMVEQAVEILRRVREQGFDVSLHIIGRPDDANYFRTIQHLAEQHAAWVFLHGVLSKEELFSLMGQNRYGINPALGEPSGVAALEMVKAGCIVFVRDGGGLAEIVATPELIYGSIDDAVGKIAKVLSDERLRRSLLDRLEHQGENFSTQAFCHNIQRVVHGFFASREDHGTV